MKNRFVMRGVVSIYIGLASVATAEDIFSSDFEGETAWFGRGDAVVTMTDEAANSGGQSLLTTGRAANWQGPAVDLLDQLVAGATYEIGAYVKVVEGNGIVTMTMQRTPTGGDTQYETVAWEVAVSDAEWVEVAGSYTFADANNDEMQLYIESPDAGLAFYVDDFSVVMTAPPLGGTAETIVAADFENGDTSGWGPRGDATVEISESAAHDGAAALLTTGRTDAWNGPSLTVTDLLEAGRTYDFNVWMKLAEGQETAPMRISLQTDQNGSSTYDWLDGNRDVSADEWVEFSGSFTATAANALTVYAESDGPLVDFLIDDFTLVAQGEPEIEDITPLKEAVAESFVMGVAIDTRETSGASSELLLKHFGQITPENLMKPESIQPEEGVFTFDGADTLIDFAEANGLQVYGHVLVWHSQTPDWFFNDADGNPLTNSPEHQQIALDRMKAHIDTVAEHFGDRVWAWDVVNEVIDESQDDGLRRSRWYEILGPDYVAQAFHFARAAFPADVKLFINDYNSEFPSKRQAYYDVVAGLMADGVPIDGVGHQLHSNLLRPVSLADASLTKFSDLGLLQAVTELDVSISTSSEESLPFPPPDRLVAEGYYLRDMFDVLRKHSDQIASVTMWGLYDERSWLRYWPIERPHEAPLLFDDQLQAKPAYWGIVDPSQLPHLPKLLNVAAADIVVDGARDLQWDYLPDIVLKAGEEGAAGTSFQLRGFEGGVYVTADVADDNPDGDMVEMFLGGAKFVANRDGSIAGEFPAAITATDNGYRVEAELPLPIAEDPIFDIRIVDGGSGEMISWSDQNHEQDTTSERLGTLAFVDALRIVDISMVSSAPEIDAVADDLWADAATIPVEVLVEGAADGATGTVQLLWDADTLYVLARVTDPALDQSNSNAWEQDSVEIFLAPGNEKIGAYQPADGQYRINFENHQSVSGDLSVIGEALTSATAVTDGGYIIEAAIAVDGFADGDIIGLDIQINDGTDGGRTAVHTWHDPTGQSFQDTKRWGVARLVK